MLTTEAHHIFDKPFRRGEHRAIDMPPSLEDIIRSSC